MSKGHSPRPYSPAAFAESHDRIFGGPRCRHCRTRMREGTALRSTLTGTPDFPGDDRAMTLSPGGPGELVAVMKCPDCGYSFTI